MEIELHNFTNEEMTRNFSNIIRESRLSFGMTQARLAELSGLHRTTIIKMEDPLKSGTTRMSSIHAVLQVLKINPNRLFYPEKTELNSHKQILIDFLSLCSKEELDIVTPYLMNYFGDNNLEVKKCDEHE